MLVLSRKKDQAIMIADNIRITILEIREGKVRIGIEAPADVSVDRLEVRVSKDKEKQQHEGIENANDVESLRAFTKRDPMRGSDAKE